MREHNSTRTLGTLAALAVLAVVTVDGSGCSGATESNGLPDKGTLVRDQGVETVPTDGTAFDLPGADARAPDPDLGPKPDLLVGSPLVINEVAPKGAPDDWFELYNRTGQAVSLDGWSFSDDIVGAPQRGKFPAGLSVPAFGFLQIVIDASYGFSLGSDEELGLYDPTGALADQVDWAEGAADTGQSYGRIPDGAGAFQTLTTPSPGKGND